MTACGYTPAEIDDMTFFDIMALLTYWRDFPPMHEILKAVFKIERKQALEQSRDDPSGIGALIALYPDGKVKQR